MKTAQSLRVYRLFLTTKFPGGSGTHLINLGKMKD